ncbi:MAG TPA: hemerythrin domain-containing protein [Ferruginibacter sp.]|nr:hemerythrin domain-containing protein [Ferruginibacter sp.]
MKRLEALAPLSRDHHQTLILAQLLKKGASAYKGLPVSAKGKITYAQEQFEKEIRNHFIKEEEVLAMATGCHESIHKLATGIKNEHRELAELFHSLGSAGDETAMHELGSKLEAHVRKEERELFPLLQQHCSGPMLESIYRLLH